ncbi:hypothetical protein ACB092_01G281500 [Castanea dentata]
MLVVGLLPIPSFKTLTEPNAVPNFDRTMLSSSITAPNKRSESLHGKLKFYSYFQNSCKISEFKILWILSLNSLQLRPSALG